MIMTSMGDRLSGVEVEEMMCEADMQGTGKVDYQAFARVITRKSRETPED